MAELRGNIRKARIALLTVTVEEYAVVSDIFDLNTNLPGTPYFVSGPKRSSFDVVGRRAPGQTNVLVESPKILAEGTMGYDHRLTANHLVPTVNVADYVQWGPFGC
jgi:hypothetical protein